ncbi:ISPsy10, transposase, truncation [Caballeronia choica]|uniref:ISPsy10, transposase, truncation n=1 Tax=Caballeronia choica TaxID=326476 RepID=A0A158KTL6_9BURK|nr:ISPsy10, transposase, truncation [Caballeronia choica]
MQNWFNLADGAREETLLVSTTLRLLLGIDLGASAFPDGTTLLKLRRPLERNKLGEQLFAKVGEVQQGRSLKVSTSTIVDGTIIAAPSSAKNVDKARGHEMHNTRKGPQDSVMHGRVICFMSSCHRRLPST